MVEMFDDPDAADQEEAMARDALVYELSVALMRLDGNYGDPHHLLWTGGTVPEPWGDAWQRYEPQAQTVLDAIGEFSARALVVAIPKEDAWVAQVVSSGPHDLPLLQWRSAEVSLSTPIGTKLYVRDAQEVEA